jgi:ketosteroid isomerase-like protein
MAPDLISPATMPEMLEKSHNFLMADLLERVMALWASPPADDKDAERAFAELYTDPVLVNETPHTCADLVIRARSLGRAFAGLNHELLERVETSDKLAIAFILRGTHVGPFPTPIGDLAPTGQDIAVRTIDVLTITDGRISQIVVVSDELGLLVGLNSIALK